MGLYKSTYFAALCFARDIKITLWIAAAGKPYLEPISRLPQGAAAGRNQFAAMPRNRYFYTVPYFLKFYSESFFNKTQNLVKYKNVFDSGTCDR